MIRSLSKLMGQREGAGSYRPSTDPKTALADNARTQPITKLALGYLPGMASIVALGPGRFQANIESAGMTGSGGRSVMPSALIIKLEAEQRLIV